MDLKLLIGMVTGQLKRYLDLYIGDMHKVLLAHSKRKMVEFGVPSIRVTD